MNLFQAIKWIFGAKKPDTTDLSNRSSTTIIHHAEEATAATAIVNQEPQPVVVENSTPTTVSISTEPSPLTTSTNTEASSGAISITQYLNEAVEAESLKPGSDQQRQEIKALKEEAEMLLAENFDKRKSD